MASMPLKKSYVEGISCIIGGINDIKFCSSRHFSFKFLSSMLSQISRAFDISWGVENELIFLALRSDQNSDDNGSKNIMNLLHKVLDWELDRILDWVLNWELHWDRLLKWVLDWVLYWGTTPVGNSTVLTSVVIPTKIRLAFVTCFALVQISWTIFDVIGTFIFTAKTVVQGIANHVTSNCYIFGYCIIYCISEWIIIWEYVLYYVKSHVNKGLIEYFI